MSNDLHKQPLGRVGLIGVLDDDDRGPIGRPLSIRGKILKDIMAISDNHCAYCGQWATVLDHIVPLASGGYCLSLKSEPVP
jgi:hypothetical protein